MVSVYIGCMVLGSGFRGLRFEAVSGARFKVCLRLTV